MKPRLLSGIVLSNTMANDGERICLGYEGFLSGVCWEGGKIAGVIGEAEQQGYHVTQCDIE